METELVFGSRTYRIVLDKAEGKALAQLDDRTLETEIARLTPHSISLSVGHRRYTAYVARSEGKTYVQVNGRLFEFEDAGVEERSVSIGAGAPGGGSISSPMPGRVVKIPVAEGQEVEKDVILVIVEAMKMENPLRSLVAGKVKKIHYAEGDLVDAGTPIVEVEPAED